MTPASLEIGGTDSAAAGEQLREHFGDSAPFVILLRGPEAGLDREGPALVAALRKDPKATTLSPWDRGEGLGRLRPEPGQALILADFHVSDREASDDVVPQLDRTIDATVSGPVTATFSGYASISREIQQESIDAAHRGELIAIPLLLIVLLIVFRSLVAALIPLALGAMTVLAARGALALLSNLFDIDAFALTVTSMMGLALGVDYALLVVSRFREELGRGLSPAEAGEAISSTAGRTVLFAGLTLLISMLFCALLLPGALLASLAGAVVVVTLIAVIGGRFVVPSALVLLGHNIDRGRIGFGGGERPWGERLAGITRRPRGVAIAVGVGLLALAAPAVALKTGPPSTEQLPPDNQAREDAESIADAVGPGWIAPFILVVTSQQGPITAETRLAALSDWQRSLAGMPSVDAVIGPGGVARRAAPLRKVGKSVFTDDAGGIGSDLGRAAGGVTKLRSGLQRAATGAQTLATGGSTAQSGAAQLSSGLAQASAGATQAQDGLARFATGATKIAKGQKQAVNGALDLKLGITDLDRNVDTKIQPPSQSLNTRLPDSAAKADQLGDEAKDADARLADALAQLQAMSVGKGDPRYAAVVDAVKDAAADTGDIRAGLSALSSQLRDEASQARTLGLWLRNANTALAEMRQTAKELLDGTRRLRGGGRKLEGAAHRAEHQASGFTSGMARLSAGGSELASGLPRLADGIEHLQRGLSSAHDRTAPLAKGLTRTETQVSSTRRKLNRDSPGLFDSGYFVLSALDGSPRGQRNAITGAVDVDRGGTTALVLAVPTGSPYADSTGRLDDRLESSTTDLAKTSGLDASVAGAAAQLHDYNGLMAKRIPLLVAVVSLITFVALVLILRAVLLAAIAVALNLLTVAAAFGVLSLLCHLPEGWPLGGNTYVDVISAGAIFGVVFGLSIDYAVFLLARMREGYDSSGSHEEAIGHGLRTTAGVITGAAATMASVFAVFALAPVATISQLGVGLTVAVLLDATVIRLVLLPALMRLCGERVWWAPAAVARLGATP